ncbi:MAG: glycoside hydrolase family 127 protein [Anaerolineae bacterium]|nr:glycoside hydrolase family 127 protein [Anaerolineae bacterium]
MKPETALSQQTFRPYARLREVEIDAVQWTGGFWAEEFGLCHHVMIENMWHLLRDPDISHAYTNFRIAAGLEDGEHHGPPFNDGDFYKWLEAVVHVYATTRDPQLDQLMDDLIALIGKAQRADGYIHTPVVIKQRQHDSSTQPFQERLDFEAYNLGHLMTTACAHHRATGKDSLLSIAIKAGDYLEHYYQESATKLARSAICPSHYMGIIDLYRTTGDPKYLQLGINLIEIRSLVEGGGDDNQDRVPFREMDRAVGHAVRANYLFAGVADVYMETGDETLLNTLERMWQSVVSQKMYITGGCGALYDGASPDGSPEQHTITRVHQSYGREYQLPNTTAYNETCANIGNVLWNWRMLAITGESRFADVLELVLYNSALSAISLDGTKFFYTNPLRRVKELPFDLRWSRTRTTYISSFCCPPNIVRTIAQAAHYAYSTSEEGIWVHLYGSSTLHTKLADGTPVRLSQQTDYPWDEDITLTVNHTPDRSFAIMLRIPEWASGASVSINGAPYQSDLAGGQYLAMDRHWQEGDSIQLHLPMPVQVLEAHPMVEEAHNHVAVKRGPVVYCLESLDLPQGVGLEDIMIPHDVQLEPRRVSEFAGRVGLMTVLEGQALLDVAAQPSNQLYRPIRQPQLQPVDVRFIPYYAWDNRSDHCEMAIWLPVVW